MRYEYDNLGNVTKVHYPDDSNSIPEVVYSYNSLGETIAVGTPNNPQRFAAYSYNADGSLGSTTLNNGGIQNSVNYNSPGWPTRIGNRKADNSLVMEQSLAYTGDGYQGSGYYNGNIAKNSINYGTWENAPQSQDYQYQYDKLGRLSVAQNPQNEQACLGVGKPTTYDINGNIETLKRGDTSNEYEYVQNTDKVNGVSNSSEPHYYGYDANGNVKRASHRQISKIDYDPLTQLTTQIQLEGETSVSFKYDGANQRVLKICQDSSGNETAAKLYVHGLNDYPLLEISEQSVQYIYGHGGLLALVKDGKVYTVLKDHLGSTRVVVDEAGTVIAAFDYLPFGDMMGVASGDPEIINYRYTGQEFDAELGMYSYRARFYDPRLGRFYATDPKAQFASPYLYAGNNPITDNDPSGMWSWKAIGAIAGAVAVTALGIGLVVGTGGAAAVVIGTGILIGEGIGGGVAAYTGIKEGLKFPDLVGYIAAGAAMGGIAGGVSAAGGVAAFATGSAIWGAAVGAGVRAVVGGGQEAANYEVNSAFGVKNKGSFWKNTVKGTLLGAVGGAISGGIAGRMGGITSAYEAATDMSQMSEIDSGFDKSIANNLAELKDTISNRFGIGNYRAGGTFRQLMGGYVNLSIISSVATKGGKTITDELFFGGHFLLIDWN